MNEPNAGARAQDGLHHPLVRMSNTLIRGGTHKDIDELIEDIEYGVMLVAQEVAKLILVEAQFAAQEAWLIENKVNNTPLKDVSVSGLTLRILKDVDGLTTDSRLAAQVFWKGQTVPVGDGGPIRGWKHCWMKMLPDDTWIDCAQVAKRSAIF